MLELVPCGYLQLQKPRTEPILWDMILQIIMTSGTSTKTEA